MNNRIVLDSSGDESSDLSMTVEEELEWSLAQQRKLRRKIQRAVDQLRNMDQFCKAHLVARVIAILQDTDDEQEPADA